MTSSRQGPLGQVAPGFRERSARRTAGRNRWIWFWTALFLAATGLWAPPLSDAPLINFRLPIFNEYGYRVWDLAAAEVRTLENDRFELSNVHLRMLAGDEAGTVDGELFAPSAVCDQAQRTISGEGQLHVIHQGAELFGEDWHYDGKTKTMVIEHHVTVSFAGDLGNILR